MFFAGQKVIIVKNSDCKEMDKYNGAVGTVAAFNPNGGYLVKMNDGVAMWKHEDELKLAPADHDEIEAHMDAVAQELKKAVSEYNAKHGTEIFLHQAGLGVKRKSDHIEEEQPDEQAANEIIQAIQKMLEENTVPFEDNEFLDEEPDYYEVLVETADKEDIAAVIDALAPLGFEVIVRPVRGDE